MRQSLVRSLFAVLVVSLSAGNLSAQERRVRLSGLASVAVGDGGPAPAISVASGFQLAPHAGFELEAVYIPSQDFEPNPIVIQIFPPPRLDVSGRTVAFISSFVTDLQTGRLRPYALLGGGIANVKRNVSVERPVTIFDLLSDATPPGRNVRPVPLPASDTVIRALPRRVRTSVSENDLVFAVGAGLDVHAWERISIAADVRYMHLFQAGRGAPDVENITRVGARVSYWF